MQDEALREHLLAQAILGTAQIDEAREAQAIYGASLGTNLVELGLVSLDDLAEHLAAATGGATPPKEWVESPEAEALATLSSEVANRYGVLPLRYVGDVLHVAMLEPEDARQREAVERAARRSVQAYVLPELRLRYALERHLGIPRPVRLVNVAKRLERVRREGAAAADDVPEEVRLRAALGIAPLAGDEELIDESEFARMHVRLVQAREKAQGGPAEALVPEIELDELAPVSDEPTPPAVGAPPAAPAGALADLAALEETLAGAADGEAAAAAAVAIACRFVRCAALFVVHRGMVMGLVAGGMAPGVRIDGVLVPADAESVLARAARAGEGFRGAPPEAGIDARVLRALGRAEAREVAVLPVRIGGRVVSVLYADDGPRPLARTALGALGALVSGMAETYERIVRARKRGG